MRVIDSLKIYYVYGLMAIAAVSTGLLVFHSLILTFILFHVVTCLGVPVVHGWWEQRLRKNWQDLANYHVINRRDCLIEGVGSGFVLMIGVLSGFYYMIQTGVSVPWIRTNLEEWGLTYEWLWVFAIYMSVGNSFFEELLWRGFTLERLGRLLSVQGAVMLSSLFYTSYHVILGTVLFGWSWGLLVATLAWVIGCYWAYLRLKYQSLAGPWMSHLLVDVGIMASLIYWIY